MAQILLLSPNRWLELYQAWRESGLTKVGFYRERMPDLCSDLVKFPSVSTFYDRFREIERSEKPSREPQKDNPDQTTRLKPAIDKPVKTRTVGSNLRVAELTLEAIEQVDMKYADRSRKEQEAKPLHPVRLTLAGGAMLEFASADPETLAIRMLNIGRVRIV